MADEDPQPPQEYDIVSPAGVGATTTNQMSPRAWQDLYLTGDQGLLDVAMEEMAADALHTFMQSLPSPNTIAGWPDVGNAPPLQASSPAGVGSQASHSPSFHSIHTTPESPAPHVVGEAQGCCLHLQQRQVLEQQRVLGVMVMVAQGLA